jgi:hypothetical protein
MVFQAPWMVSVGDLHASLSSAPLSPHLPLEMKRDVESEAVGFGRWESDLPRNKRSRLVEHRLKPLASESSRKRVLLAGMVGTDEGHAIGK